MILAIRHSLIRSATSPLGSRRRTSVGVIRRSMRCVGTVEWMRIGLTGGLGAGKSTVASLLAKHGAIVVDADVLAREVVRSGTPGFAAVVDRFGRDVIGPDGELNRQTLAKLV